jgi:uncharacterized protein
MERVKDMILMIALALVDHPEQVSVNVIGKCNTIVFELTVAKRDMGKVIGKQGRIVSAIGSILNAAAGKTGKGFLLKIVDER